MGELGRLESIGSHRVGHNWGDLACMHVRVPFLGQEDTLGWKSQPTPVFLPGKSHGQSTVSQRVGHNLATKQTYELKIFQQLKYDLFWKVPGPMLDKMCYHLLFYHHPFNLMNCWRSHGEELFKYMNSWYDIIFLFFLIQRPEIKISLCMLSHFSYVPLFVTQWTAVHRAPLSRGFFRQEYWRGVPFSSPGYFPDPVIESTSLMSPALPDGIFTTLPPGKSSRSMSGFKMFPKLFPPINIHWLDLRFFCIPLFFPSFFFFF